MGKKIAVVCSAKDKYFCDEFLQSLCEKTDRFSLKVDISFWEDFSDCASLKKCDAIVFMADSLSKLFSERLRNLKNAMGFCSDKVYYENGTEKTVLVKDLLAGFSVDESGFRNGMYGRECFDVYRNSEIEMEKTIRIAFETAQKEKKTLLNLDKGCFSATSRLWRYAVHEIAEDYPDVLVEDAELASLVDGFDYNGKVVVCDNLTGDTILPFMTKNTNKESFFAESVGSDSLFMISVCCAEKDDFSLDNVIDYFVDTCYNMIGR